jgi:hypothetical protein
VGMRSMPSGQRSVSLWSSSSADLWGVIWHAVLAVILVNLLVEKTSMN